MSIFIFLYVYFSYVYFYKLLLNKYNAYIYAIAAQYPLTTMIAVSAK